MYEKDYTISNYYLDDGRCDEQNSDGSYDTSRSFILKTIVIDSCEYIKGYNRLAHKGNCLFCKERRQKELKDIIEQLKKN